jgi:osmotically-inducible protein OsmY
MKTNEELRNDVVDEIKWDPQVKDVSNQINVVAKEGIITLLGVVDSYGKKMACERAAQRVAGVKIVASDIEVDPVRKKTDSEIAEAVESALHWNSSINNDQVKILVNDGLVYLDGAVDWEYQRKLVQRSVENLIGVRGIVNNISINPKPFRTKDIKESITDVFKRNAIVDASSIVIETAGSSVTLRGTVRSWAEKKEAEKVVWAFPGVQMVDNQIEVDMSVLAE